MWQLKGKGKIYNGIYVFSKKANKRVHRLVPHNDKGSSIEFSSPRATIKAGWTRVKT